jgi:hypothetical protein
VGRRRRAAAGEGGARSAADRRRRPTRCVGPAADRQGTSPPPPMLSSRTAMTRESALSEAFCSWFDHDELIHHLIARPYGEEVLRHLPREGSRMQLCIAVVDALQRRALIDRDFFDELTAARPNRATAIPTAARCGPAADTNSSRTSAAADSARSGRPSKPAPASSSPSRSSTPITRRTAISASASPAAPRRWPAYHTRQSSKSIPRSIHRRHRRPFPE